MESIINVPILGYNSDAPAGCDGDPEIDAALSVEYV